MKNRIILVSFLLIGLTHCPISRHVNAVIPIEGEYTEAEKIHIADQLVLRLTRPSLGKMLIEKFPDLTNEDLNGIRFQKGFIFLPNGKTQEKFITVAIVVTYTRENLPAMEVLKYIEAYANEELKKLKSK